MNTNSKENTGYQINCSHTSPSNLARNEKQKTTNPLIHNILIPAAPSAHPKPSPTGGIEKNKKRKHMKCCLGDITCPLPARFCLRSSPKNPVQTPYEMSSYTSEHYLPSLLLLALTFSLGLAAVFFVRHLHPAHALHACASHRYVSLSYRPNKNTRTDDRCITRPGLKSCPVSCLSHGLADETLVHRTKAASTRTTACTGIAW
jgi:hypothetical protein